ncbi:phage repressor protein CI [Vibrio fluvialis]|nr:phage repressor protein CI [Vibrio fluvialis]
MDKILPFDYLKGEAFTEKLKEVTGCKTLLEMSERFDVPKTTFSAWNTHERTSHELIVRLHLALGIPVEELALKPEDRKSEFSGMEFTPTLAGALYNAMRSEEEGAQTQTVVLNSFCLTNGQLLETGNIPYASRIFNSWNIDRNNAIEIETNDGRYIVDKKQNDAVSGSYLIEINGRMSINHIQRLPNKLAVVFGDSTVEVAEEDIKVIGRVAVTLRKD